MRDISHMRRTEKKREKKKKIPYGMLLIAPLILMGFIIVIAVEMLSEFAHRAVIRFFTRPSLK